MSLRAHISILVLALATLVFILRLVRRHRLRAKYSVLWVSLGAGLAILASAPAILEGISNIVGIKTPVLTFLLMAITFLLVLTLHFSWELSRLEDRTRSLAEECALLRQEVEARDPAPEGAEGAGDAGDARAAEAAGGAGDRAGSGAGRRRDHDQPVGGERRA